MDIQNNKGISGASQPTTPPLPTTPPADPSLSASSVFADCPAPPNAQQDFQLDGNLIERLIGPDPQETINRQQQVYDTMQNMQELYDTYQEVKRAYVEIKSDSDDSVDTDTDSITDNPPPITPTPDPTPVPTCPPAPEASPQHGLESGSALGPKPERI